MNEEPTQGQSSGLDIKAIQARCDKATPGDWLLFGLDELRSALRSGDRSLFNRHDSRVPVATIEDDWGNWVVYVDRPKPPTRQGFVDASDFPSNAIAIPTSQIRANAEFIAHARQDIPALIAALRHANESIEYFIEAKSEVIEELGQTENALRDARAEIGSLQLRLRTLAEYAVHLGNCTWFQDGDVCSCGLAAFSELFDEPQAGVAA